VAQKSRRTTFPLSWERVISCPSKDLREKSGAELEGGSFPPVEQRERKNAPPVQMVKIKNHVRKDRFMSSRFQRPSDFVLDSTWLKGFFNQGL
jgi:hypothetical protein